MRIPQLVPALLLLGSTALGLSSQTLSAQSPLNTQPAPAAWLQALDASAATVQSLSPVVTDTAPNLQLTFTVELAGVVETITLRRRDIRTDGYELLVDDGVSIRSIEPGPTETWVGEITGEVGSRVAASFRNDSIRAIVRRANDELIGIQPAFEIAAGTAPELHLVHDAADAVSQGESCGVNAPPVGPSPTNGPNTGEDMIRIAEIAIEGDFTLYQALNNNAASVESTILATLNLVNVIYERDVNIRHEVSATLIRTAADPYTTNDAGNLLGQFRNWWNANRGTTQRDVAHLFTGRNLNGSTIGIARLASVCNRPIAYGLSQILFSNNINRRVGLVAHELGHCWSAVHCDGDSDCAIMCAGLGGCTNNLGAFGNRSIGLISGYRNAAACLSADTPNITSITPLVIPSLRLDPVQINGTNLSGATEVAVDGQPLPPGQFTVINDTLINFTAPTPTALGIQQISVTTGSGASNQVAVFRTGNSPAVVTGPTVWVAGFPLQIEAGSQPNRSVFLFANVNDPLLIPFFGLNLISSPVLIANGSSDSIGLIDFSIPTPLGVRGVDLRLQLLDLNASNTLIETASVPFLVQFF